MSDGINALDIVDTYDYDVGPGTPTQDTGYDYDVGPGTIQEPIVGGNLETDYVVDQRGRVIDSGGNVIKEAPVVDKGGFSFDKMLNNLFKGVSSGASKAGNFFQENPLTGIAGLLLMSQLLKSGGGGGQAAGYTGPGINMGLKATRQPIQQPEYRPYSGQAVMGRQFFSPVTYAAAGGQMKSGRYLDGPTDGMADKIPSSIDGKQPARLSHGEFVIPADVVSHLGNGNSDAGAKVLYNMMAKVRKARTGSTEQGKRINPEKFTPGGIAAYANGGVVKMAEGGPPPGASTSQNLSAWAGPYVTDYLSKAQALSQMPYQPFQGPLSAGVSPLQQQAFQGLASLDMPWQYGAGSGMAYQAGTGSFTRPGTSQAFMSPYMQDVVDIEKREAQRQADIARTQRGAQAVKAGAFGGSRQAILDAEAQRNLAQQMGDIQTKGMQSAYDRAVQQYNAERDAQLRAAMGLGTLGQQQFGTQLQGLQGILSAGGTQRDVEQQGIKALMDEYNKQMMWPYQQLQFQQSMLQGLPVATATTTPAEMSGIGKLTSLIGAGGSGYDLLKKIGLL